MRLKELLPLLDLEFDATLVSLQKEVPSEDVPILRNQSKLLHFGDELKDFSETAALISCLDLVISVDTRCRPPGGWRFGKAGLGAAAFCSRLAHAARRLQGTHMGAGRCRGRCEVSRLRTMMLYFRGDHDQNRQ